MLRFSHAHIRWSRQSATLSFFTAPLHSATRTAYGDSGRSGGYGRGGGANNGSSPSYDQSGRGRGFTSGVRGGGGARYGNYAQTAHSTPSPYANAASAAPSPSTVGRGGSLDPSPGTTTKSTASESRGEVSATFWSQVVRHVPTAELKRHHLNTRTLDKKSRFLVRSRIREDGVLSNLFPLSFTTGGAAGEAEGQLYIYEMYVTRLVPVSSTSGEEKMSTNNRSSKHTTTTTTTTPSSSSSGKRKGTSSSQAVAVKATTEKRVSSGRSWHAIQRYLRHRFSDAATATLLPPLVQLENKIYAAGPLPGDALQLPETYFDVTWKTAELRLVKRCRLPDLLAGELQMVVNKVVLEMVREAHRAPSSSSTRKNAIAGAMELVRERTGKLVCTMQGISSGGLRVYRGVYVQAIFVDGSAAEAYEPAVEEEEGKASIVSAGGGKKNHPAPNVVATRQLGETPVGLTDAQTPVHFRVESFLRAFAYRGTPVESYQISDASGSFVASVWSPAQPQALQIGAVYAAAPVRIREFAERGNARLIELPGGTRVTLIAAAPQKTSEAEGGGGVTTEKKNGKQRKTRGAGIANVAEEAASPSRIPGKISLKIDTKGTIASEVSLWAELLQHYGSGPYDETTQQRIRKSLVNMPVVISYSLRQGIVRELRFDGEALIAAATGDATTATFDRGTAGVPTNARVSQLSVTTTRRNADGESVVRHCPAMGARESRLLPLLPQLDAQQPCAVLADYTVVPLQVLHCCFDPTMKGWQDTAIAVLSLMPNERMELLNFVRGLLVEGLQRWGIRVARQPWRTKALSLLPMPMKNIVSKPGYSPRGGNGTSTSTFPTTLAVLGIVGPRCTADQAQRVQLTVQHLAQNYRTRLANCVSDESAGLQFLQGHLMQAAQGTPTGVQLRDANSSVLLITTEPDTRATRWLKAECMSQGIHFIAIPPSGMPSRLNLLCANVKRRIRAQFESNPLRGVDVHAEVPVLGRRAVLFVGVDTCHTNTHSVCALVGIHATRAGNHIAVDFWMQDARGRETGQVAVHFQRLLQRVLTQYGRVDEVVVFQDGDVFSELAGFKDELAAQLPGVGLTFMCLHKRCNVRFIHASRSRDAGTNVHKGGDGEGYHNAVKGVVVSGLAPVPLDYEVVAPSFYLQAHESSMSTARAVQYTVHHTSPTLDVADVQQMANVMANVLAPQATKLPMSTRCAHRLADQAERLLDAVPQLSADMIPRPLCDRLWFL